MDLFIILIFLIPILYFTYRGTVIIFQRHDTILVILYIILVFPIAFCHTLILGIGGPYQLQNLLSTKSNHTSSRIVNVGEFYMLD
jgi:hypothetical protein